MAYDAHERTVALLAAVQQGDQDRVSYLLKDAKAAHHHGFVDTADEKRCSVLAHSIREHHTSIAEMLMEAGASTNHVDSSGKSAFHYAVLSGNVHLVELLVMEYDADVHALSNPATGRTALHDAVSKGHIDVVEVLLEEEGFDVDAVDTAVQQTALDMACAAQRHDIAALLRAPRCGWCRKRAGSVPHSKVVRLTPCRCMAVSYCSAQCVKDHWHKHEFACALRLKTAAEASVTAARAASAHQ